MKAIKFFALLMIGYAAFFLYVAAIFNGKLPMMQNNEPARMCAAFQDGTTYGRDSILSIDAYHKKTEQVFEMVACTYGK